MTPALYKRLNSIIDMSFYQLSQSIEVAPEAEDKSSAVGGLLFAAQHMFNIF